MTVSPDCPTRTGNLIVYIFQARDLINRALIGKQSAFVVLTYDGREVRGQVVKRGGENPKFGQRLELTLNKQEPQDQLLATRNGLNSCGREGCPCLSERSVSKLIEKAQGAARAAERGLNDSEEIKVEVFAQLGSGPRLIGFCYIGLEEIFSTGSVNDWYELQTMKGRFAGVLELQMSFLTSDDRLPSARASTGTSQLPACKQPPMRSPPPRRYETPRASRFGKTDLFNLEAQAEAWSEAHSLLNETQTETRPSQRRLSHSSSEEEGVSARSHVRSRSRSPSAFRRAATLSRGAVTQRRPHHDNLVAPTSSQHQPYPAAPSSAYPSSVSCSSPFAASSPASASLFTGPPKSPVTSQARPQYRLHQLPTSPLSQVADSVVGAHPYYPCVDLTTPSSPHHYSLPSGSTGAQALSSSGLASFPYPILRPQSARVSAPCSSPPPSNNHLFPYLLSGDTYESAFVMT